MDRKNEPLVFYDAIYQRIVITDPLVKSLIYTPEFQRLKYIRQLGTLSLVFNSSSNHTRFAHCLGVYHLITSLFARKQFDKFSFQRKREVAIAGLLHDLGHGPFSHIFEKVIDNFHHENFSAKIIQNHQGSIYVLLQKYGINLDRVVNLILNKSQNDWGQNLISGQFDLDRLDYLLRDCYFLGVSSGINLKRLLDNLFVVNEKIIFREKVLLDLENYLLFRFYMHKTFFWHPENVFLENVFSAIFQRIKDLIKEKKLTVFSQQPLWIVLTKKLPTTADFLKLTDYELLHFFAEVQRKSDDVILKKLLTIFLQPSQSKPYLSDFSKPEWKKMEANGWPKKYFYYQNTLSLKIYEKDCQEIWILTDQNKQQRMSMVSIFFDRTRLYRKQFQFLVNF